MPEPHAPAELSSIETALHDILSRLDRLAASFGPDEEGLALEVETLTATLAASVRRLERVRAAAIRGATPRAHRPHRSARGI